MKIASGALIAVRLAGSNQAFLRSYWLAIDRYFAALRIVSQLADPEPRVYLRRRARYSSGQRGSNAWYFRD